MEAVRVGALVAVLGGVEVDGAEVGEAGRVLVGAARTSVGLAVGEAAPCGAQAARTSQPAKRLTGNEQCCVAIYNRRTPIRIVDGSILNHQPSQRRAVKGAGEAEYKPAGGGRQ